MRLVTPQLLIREDITEAFEFKLIIFLKGTNVSYYVDVANKD